MFSGIRAKGHLQWADKQRSDEKLVEAVVLLLAQIIRILTPLPFFRGSVVGVVNKLIAPQERYHDLVSRLRLLLHPDETPV